ncbi:hypothetical protein ACFLSG_03350 [Candidatus Bipolaricaulota bacterium]
MEAAVELEKLVSLARTEALDKMPRLVRTRYEMRLTTLRQALKSQRSAYPLGAILVSIGAVTDEQLNHALHVQEESHSQKLLGEFLVELGLFDREKLSHALAIQASIAQSFNLPYLPEAEVYDA